MAVSSVALIILVLVSVSRIEAETIDEIIFGASDSLSSLEFIGDLHGDVVRHELDMMLSMDQYRILTGTDNPDSRSKRKAIKRESARWKNAIIHYKIAPNTFSSSESNEITRAITEWQDNTCIKFQRATSRTSNYVYFKNGSGCYSYVGMTGGGQDIGLARGCRQKGVIAHEIGHAVGFHHEQNRPDRDNHVIIHTQNIPASVRYNFKKYPYSAVSTMGVPYDYRSVMHYGGRAFSQNGQYTIQTRDPAFQKVIGNREGLSFLDVKLANLMYTCNSHCDSSIKCPSQGFVGKDCKCWCPGGSPTKLCDDTDTDGSGRTTTTSRSTTARPTVTPPCKDYNRNCVAWANGGYCTSNTYVKTYCRAACNTCDGDAEKETCKDLAKYCKAWQKQGFCRGTYEAFMTENCAQTCNTCGSGSSSGQNGSAGDNNSGSDVYSAGDENSANSRVMSFLVLVVCAALPVLAI